MIQSGNGRIAITPHRTPLLLSRFRKHSTRMAAVYDVCIVGSGAGGGMAAHALTQAGAHVVMLEAGPAWFASHDINMILADDFFSGPGAGVENPPLWELRPVGRG